VSACYNNYNDVKGPSKNIFYVSRKLIEHNFFKYITDNFFKLCSIFYIKKLLGAK